MARVDLARQPSANKFEERGGDFRASTALGASFLLADLVAARYGVHLPSLARGRLLDLGCGRAPLRSLYQDRADQIVFADIESRDATLAPFVLADAAADLPFADDAFDVVVLSDVLEHLSSPRDTIADIARILRPGGTLIGNTPYLYWIHEEPYDFWRPSRFALQHELQRAGFCDIEVTAIGGSIEVVTDLVAKHLGAVPLIGPRLGGVLGRLGSRWARSKPGRRLAATTGDKYPLAHFFVAGRPTVESP